MDRRDLLVDIFVSFFVSVGDSEEHVAVGLAVALQFFGDFLGVWQVFEEVHAEDEVECCLFRP